MREAVRLLDEMKRSFATQGCPRRRHGQAETAVALAMVDLRHEAQQVLSEMPGDASSEAPPTSA
jgi:hypothetical protein